jgi:phosphate transport system permease protein
VVITGGGVGIILSLAAIFFVIFAETWPLWGLPTAEQNGRFNLPRLTAVNELGSAEVGKLVGSSKEMVKPLALGVDEYQEIAYLVTGAGTVEFLSLKDGQFLQRYEIRGLEEQSPTAAYYDPLHHTVALGTANGVVVPLGVRFSVIFQDDQRTVRPEVAEGKPFALDPQGRAIKALVYKEEEGKIAAAALVGPHTLVFFAAREKRSLFGQSRVEEYHADLSVVLKSDVTALALDSWQLNLLAGTFSGEIYHWQIRDPQDPHFIAAYKNGAQISVLGWLLGERSLVVGDSAGGVSTWFQVRDPQRSGEAFYRRIHTLGSHRAAVTAAAPSLRDRGLLTADAVGTVLLHHTTSEQTLLELSPGNSSIAALAFAPKANGVLAVDAQGDLSHWSLYNPHPEVTLRTLFGKVWYEGYEKPEYVWQSTGGTDDFEPKLSLTPLVYGTLKGTFYALLLAIPLSICAAIYTAQFMHPSLRNLVKPTVEVMAALPSVVLGFFAGLWLAPLVEQIVPAMFLMLLALPLVTLGASSLWQWVPVSWRSQLRPGVELAFLCPMLLLTVWACISLNGLIEAALFNGSFPQWLYDTFGLRYDPRNSLVVGFAMGFAVIPLIYTISEDALSNVPQHLISGSLALGATRWQTAMRVVLPTASPGLFSAVMIGFGRAVGETMIVLMAAGNTPVMDFNMFSGFRALSANIAVEIPEAPYGGTLYRVLFLAALLLFVMTFLVNTAAEVVRQRLRERYSQI